MLEALVDSLKLGGTPLTQPTGKMDPSALAWINAGSNVLGRMLSPSGAPSSADARSSAYASFDNSGFNVAFGNARAASSAGLSPWLIGGGLVAAALVGIVAVKRAWKSS